MVRHSALIALIGVVAVSASNAVAPPPADLELFEADVASTPCAVTSDDCSTATCAKGSYYYGNWQGKDYCVKCPTGYTSAGCTNCSPDPSRTACKLSTGGCPVGKYTTGFHCTDCPAGKWQSKENKAECYNCPSGMFQPTSGNFACYWCPVGRFTPKQTVGSVKCTKCDTCAKGKYGTTHSTGSIGADSCGCTGCPTGKYTAAGYTTCFNCPKGRFAPHEGGYSCYTCPLGKYGNILGSDKCAGCESGKFTTVLGSEECHAMNSHTVYFKAYNYRYSAVLAPKGWQLLGWEQMATYAELFKQAYVSSGGLAMMGSWKTSSCCLTVDKGYRLTVEGKSYVYPMDSTGTSLRCSTTENNYEATEMYRLAFSDGGTMTDVSAAKAFGAAGGSGVCATKTGEGNPGIYMATVPGVSANPLYCQVSGNTRLCVDRDVTAATPAPTPEACELGDYGPWGNCTEPCGGGVQTATRPVLSNPHNQACGIRQMTSNCNVGPCPVHCSFVALPWTDCTASCDGGTQSQTYQILRQSAHNGDECPTAHDQVCNTEACPIPTTPEPTASPTKAPTASPTDAPTMDPTSSPTTVQNCTVSDYSEWTACSENCGSGWQFKTRHVTLPAVNGGEVCPDLSEMRTCKLKDCPVHCEHTYLPWTECSSSCDGGISYRRVMIVTAAAAGGRECPLTEQRVCNLGSCPTQAPTYSPDAPTLAIKCEQKVTGFSAATFTTAVQYGFKKGFAAVNGLELNDITLDASNVGDHRANYHAVDSVSFDFIMRQPNTAAGIAKLDAARVNMRAANTSALVAAVKPFVQDLDQSDFTIENVGYCEDETMVNPAFVVEFELFSYKQAASVAQEGWELLNFADFTHSRSDDAYSVTDQTGVRSLVMRSYTENHGFRVIDSWQSSGCCIAIAGGSRLTSDNSGYFYPLTNSKQVMCAETGLNTYTKNTRYNLGFNSGNSINTLDAAGTLSAATGYALCQTKAGEQNPGIYMRKTRIGETGLYHLKNARGGNFCNLVNGEKLCLDLPEIDCVATPWAWSGCDSTCGAGNQSATREFTRQAAQGGIACGIKDTDSRACMAGPCPVHCDVSTYGDFGVCTKTCGGGKKTKRRSVTRHAAHGGFVCPHLSEEENCNDFVCPTDAPTAAPTVSPTDAPTAPLPINCTVGNWKKWGECSQECLGGERVASRDVLRNAEYGGEACPHLSKTDVCNTGPCPIHCEVVKLPWGDCSKSCDTGIKFRYMKIITYAQNNGTECPTTEHAFCNTQACPTLYPTSAPTDSPTDAPTAKPTHQPTKAPTVPPPPPIVNCSVSNFSSWDACSVACGKGYQQRVRGVETSAANGGTPCPSLSEIQNCVGTTCPVHCNYTWGSWESCSADCGGGVELREAVVTGEAINGGNACPGVEQRVCNTEICVTDFPTPAPTSGTPTPAPTPMPYSDVFYKSYNYRYSSVLASNGWKLMSSTDITCYQGLFLKYYEKNGGLDMMGTWSSTGCCITLQGGYRMTVNDASYVYPFDYLGNVMQCAKSMKTNYHVAVSYRIQYHENNKFKDVTSANKLCGAIGSGACAVTAGEGNPGLYMAVMPRRGRPQEGQYCENHHQHDAQGRKLAQKTDLCIPVFKKDCVTSGWRTGACTKTCGTGYAPLTRRILTHPVDGGKPCPSLTDQKACIMKMCPVDCTIGDYIGGHGWSQCSKTCGMGVQSRHRKIITGPKYGGVCPGAVETRECIGFPLHTCNECCDKAWPHCHHEDHNHTFQECPTDHPTKNPTAMPTYAPTAIPTARPTRAVVDCTVSNWTISRRRRRKQACDAPCGGGVQQQTRSIIAAPAMGGRPCPGLIEYSNCNDHACPIDCHFTFMPWTDCSQPCGGGKQTRPLIIIKSSAGTGAHCPSAQTRACNEQACPTPAPTKPPTPAPTKDPTKAPSTAPPTAAPTGAPTEAPVDCVMAPWSEWDECSAVCGGGVQEQRRNVQSEAQHGGDPCTSAIFTRSSTRTCNGHPCPVDCKLTIISWSACSKTCGHGYRTATFEVDTVSKHGGLACPSEEREVCIDALCPPPTFAPTEAPTNEPTKDPTNAPTNAPTKQPTSAPTPEPVDCVADAYGAYGECSEVCGGGYQERERKIRVAAAFGGEECTDLRSLRDCNTHVCPVDCEFKYESLWSVCSQTCGQGISYQHVKIYKHASHNGVACPISREKVCKVANCPTPYPTPVPTEFPTTAPTSSPTKPPTSAPTMSPTSPTSAPTPHAPVDCIVSEWSSYAACTFSCGGGSSTRDRIIVRAPAYGGAECPITFEHKACGVGVCPIDCALDVWNDWGNCTAKCGGGTSTRTRDLLAESQYGGQCGARNDLKVCNRHVCPIDCKVSNFSEWGSCTRTCGGGISTHTRGIQTQNAYGGKSCPILIEDKNCMMALCSIDCELTGWSEWSECSKTCLVGTHTRSRLVKREAENGGNACDAERSETQNCNIGSCPVHCEVTDFTSWGECTKKCAGGMQHRTRTITSRFHMSYCPSLVESRTCNSDRCAVDCVVPHCPRGLTAPALVATACTPARGPF